MNDTMGRLYALGGPGSVDVSFNATLSTRPVATVLIAGVWDTRHAGVQLMYAGTAPKLDAWTTGWTYTASQRVHEGQTYTTTFTLAANQCVVIGVPCLLY